MRKSLGLQQSATMTEIGLKVLQHKGMQVLMIQFPFDMALADLIKKIPDYRWSQQYRAWYFVFSLEKLAEIETTLAAQHAYTVVKDSSVDKAFEDTLLRLKNQVFEQNKKAIISQRIDYFISWMRSRRYSESTIQTYSKAIKVFFYYHFEKEINELENDDIIEFNNKYILAKNYSASLQNQVVNAIKLFYVASENHKIDIELILRPKREKVLPNVLSKEEVKKLLENIVNIKHRAMLSLIYSSGLRCGELLHLKPEHVDSKRMVLLIKQGKGAKDRITPLSVRIVELLRNYYKLYRPKTYLFEGVKKGEPYDARSLQQVMKQSLKRAGIEKAATLHWLRHSYATHLLESGTDLRYIQEILGHQSSRTTEIYTHVSTNQLKKIISPFDTL